MNITALRLRALREKKGLSQRDVARQIGVTRAALSKTHNDSIDNLRLLVVYWQNNFEIFYNAKDRCLGGLFCVVSIRKLF